MRDDEFSNLNPKSSREKILTLSLIVGPPGIVLLAVEWALTDGIIEIVSYRNSLRIGKVASLEGTPLVVSTYLVLM